VDCHSDREPEPEIETPKKESFFKRNGPVIFWGSMIAMPAMNLAAAIINMKTTQKGLESEQLRLAIEQLKQQATQS
jgi:hypothetical protein